MQRSWSWKRSISPCALGRRPLDCLRRDTNMSYQRKQISNAVHTVSLFVPGSKRPLFFTRVKPQKPLYCSGTSSKWAVLSGKHHSHELISDSTTRSSETDKHTCVGYNDGWISYRLSRTCPRHILPNTERKKWAVTVKHNFSGHYSETAACECCDWPVKIFKYSDIRLVSSDTSQVFSCNTEA